MKRKSLEHIFMSLAYDLASRSKDSTLKVGCVITDKSMERVLSIGYNGGAKGQSDERESDEPGKSNLIHAEINCLIKSNYSIQNKIMFITHFPCRLCCKVIVNAGIKKVYYCENYRDTSGLEILINANIIVERLIT